LNQFAPASSEQFSLFRVRDQTPERLNPILDTPRQKAVFAMRNDLAVHSDVGSGHGGADTHVLQDFVTAFTALPNRIPERHNANVKAGEVRLLRFQSPRLVLNHDAIELERLVACYFLFQTSET